MQLTFLLAIVALVSEALTLSKVRQTASAPSLRCTSVLVVSTRWTPVLPQQPQLWQGRHLHEGKEAKAPCLTAHRWLSSPALVSGRQQELVVQSDQEQAGHLLEYPEMVPGTAALL